MHGVSRLTLQEDVALISFAKIPCGAGTLSNIFDCFSKYGINVDMISQSTPLNNSTNLSLTCPGNAMGQVLKLTRELKLLHPELIPLVVSGSCKISLFGLDMQNSTGVFARAVSALCSLPVELRLVTTSEVDISLLIDSLNSDDAVNALNKAFCL